MSSAEGLEEFFLNSKPVRIMIKLRDRSSGNYASSLSREVEATYAHTVKIIGRMEEMGLVDSERKGRKKLIYLTEDGEDIAGNLVELINKFKQLNGLG